MTEWEELEKRARHSGWKWISTKRTRSSQTEKMSEESNITMPPEEMIEDWNNRMEKKMPTSATNELGKHPSKKVITELLQKPTTKEQACSGLMENISRL